MTEPVRGSGDEYLWQPSTFTCPRCGTSSANPNDTREGYCARCHDWTGGPVGIGRIWETTEPEYRAEVERVMVETLIEMGYTVTKNGGGGYDASRVCEPGNLCPECRAGRTALQGPDDVYSSGDEQR